MLWAGAEPNHLRPTDGIQTHKSVEHATKKQTSMLDIRRAAGLLFSFML
jgi:hypothetical protein